MIEPLSAIRLGRFRPSACELTQYGICRNMLSFSVQVQPSPISAQNARSRSVLASSTGSACPRSRRATRSAPPHDQRRASSDEGPGQLLSERVLRALRFTAGQITADKRVGGCRLHLSHRSTLNGSACSVFGPRKHTRRGGNGKHTGSAAPAAISLAAANQQLWPSQVGSWSEVAQTTIKWRRNGRRFVTFAFTPPSGPAQTTRRQAPPNRSKRPAAITPQGAFFLASVASTQGVGRAGASVPGPLRFFMVWMRCDWLMGPPYELIRDAQTITCVRARPVLLPVVAYKRGKPGLGDTGG